MRNISRFLWLPLLLSNFCLANSPEVIQKIYDAVLSDNEQKALEHCKDLNSISPDLLDKALGKKGEEGTLLYYAARSGHLDVVKKLLRLGDNPNSINGKFQSTPLQSATAKSHLKITKELLKFDAKVGGKNSVGNTLLHSLARQGDPQILKEVLRYSSLHDLEVKNSASKTPLEVALAEKNKEHANLLKNAHSKLSSASIETINDLSSILGAVKAAKNDKTCNGKVGVLFDLDETLLTRHNLEFCSKLQKQSNKTSENTKKPQEQSCTPSQDPNKQNEVTSLIEMCSDLQDFNPQFKSQPDLKSLCMIQSDIPQILKQLKDTSGVELGALTARTWKNSNSDHTYEQLKHLGIDFEKENSTFKFAKEGLHDLENSTVFYQNRIFFTNGRDKSQVIQSLINNKQFQCLILVDNEISNLVDVVYSNNDPKKEAPDSKVRLFHYTRFKEIMEGKPIEEKQKPSSTHETKLDNLIHLYENQSNQLDSQIQILTKDQKAKLVKAFLQDYYDKLDPSDPKMEETFNHFLKVFDKMYPKIQIFDYFHDFERNVMNLKSLDVLVDHFNKKPTYQGKLGEITTIDGSKLTQFLDDLASKKFQGDTTLLLRNIGMRHISPVMIRVIDGKTTIIIPDSMEWNSRHNVITNLQKLIDQSQLKNVEIYSFATRRQGDQMSCPIMSLRDILESSRVSLYDYVSSVQKDNPKQITQIDQKGTNSNLYILDNLPPRFMKIGQDLDTIRNYQKTNCQWSDMIVREQLTKKVDQLNPSKSTLSEFVDLNTQKLNKRGTLVDVNFYTRKKFFKYSNILINSLVDQQ